MMSRLLDDRRPPAVLPLPHNPGLHQPRAKNPSSQGQLAAMLHGNLDYGFFASSDNTTSGANGNSRDGTYFSGTSTPITTTMATTTAAAAASDAHVRSNSAPPDEGLLSHQEYLPKSTLSMEAWQLWGDKNKGYPSQSRIGEGSQFEQVPNAKRLLQKDLHQSTPVSSPLYREQEYHDYDGMHQQQQQFQQLSGYDRSSYRRETTEHTVFQRINESDRDLTRPYDLVSSPPARSNSTPPRQNGLYNNNNNNSAPGLDPVADLVTRQMGSMVLSSEENAYQAGQQHQHQHYWQQQQPFEYHDESYSSGTRSQIHAPAHFLLSGLDLTDGDLDGGGSGASVDYYSGAYGRPPYNHTDYASFLQSNEGALEPGTLSLIQDRKLRALQIQKRQQEVLYQQQHHHQLLAARQQLLSQQQQFQASAEIHSVQRMNGSDMRSQRTTKDMAFAVQSRLLQEFRNSKNKKYELKDIVGHIVEFSGDQHGSRFIQQKLETANSEEKQIVFEEVLTNALQLMTDVFGNYVLQKFFEHGSQAQKTILAKQMEGHIVSLSLQMYGCRVIQKALEYVLIEQQARLVSELNGCVLQCIKDQNGNHVIQKAIERVPAQHIQFIIDAFHGQAYNLATHPYGCRVIQRMFEHCTQAQIAGLLDELHLCTHKLVQDQYGNYVIQHIIERGQPADRSMIINKIRGQVLHFSKHKFASNVVEKCVNHGTALERHQLIEEVLQTRHDRSFPLVLMMKDQYANYVVQKMLEVADDEQRVLLVAKTKPHLQSLKRFTYGRHLLMKVEKLLRLTNNAEEHENESLYDIQVDGAAATANQQ